MKRKSLFSVLVMALCLVLLLSACGLKKSAEKSTPVTVNLKDLEGVYSEETAHRGVLQFSARDAENANIVINWPGSLTENARWAMSGTYDAEKQAIVYSDAVLIEQTTDASGVVTDQQISSNGTGTIVVSGNNLVWTDDNAYIGSDPVTFVWSMSMADYLTAQSAATPAVVATPAPSVEPTPEPTPTPTPSAAPVATPEPSLIPGAPIVYKQPTDETVKEGGACSFATKQEKAATARWHFLSPDAQTDLQYDEIGDRFPGLIVKQGEYSILKLSNIPYELNGWRFYCRFTNAIGSTDSAPAMVTVEKAGTAATTTTQGGANAKGAPVVLKSPTDETVKVGGSCWFVAKENGAVLARWHFVSPDGQTDLQYDEAVKQFPGLRVKNGEYSGMQLINIPAELDGWKFYCHYTNKAGYADSEMATVTVTKD